MGIVNTTVASPGDDRGEGEIATNEAVERILEEFNGKITNENLSSNARIALSKIATGLIGFSYKSIDAEETVSVDTLSAAPTADVLENVTVPQYGLVLVGFEGLLNPTGYVGIDSTKLNIALFLNGVQLKRYNNAAASVFNAEEMQFEPDVWAPYGSDSDIGVYGYPMTVNYGGDSGGHVLGAGTQFTVGAGDGLIPIYASGDDYDIEVRYLYTKTDDGLTTPADLKIKNRRIYALSLRRS